VNAHSETKILIVSRVWKNPSQGK